MSGGQAYQRPVVEHCGEPMSWTGTRWGWAGDEELATHRLRCPACGATAVCEIRTPSPAPVRA